MEVILNSQLVRMYDEVLVYQEEGDIEFPAVVVDYCVKYIGRINSEDIPSGVYRDHSQVLLQYTYGEVFEQSVSRMRLRDSREYIYRLREYGIPAEFNLTKLEYMKPLPRTAFWEGDIVQIATDELQETIKHQYGGPYDFYYILDIAYEYVQEQEEAAVYTISPSVEGTCSIVVLPSEIELVDRGVVWRKYNGVYF